MRDHIPLGAETIVHTIVMHKMGRDMRTRARLSTAHVVRSHPSALLSLSDFTTKGPVP